MERSKGHKPNQSYLDRFFITKDQEVVFVFICDPSFNMVKPITTNRTRQQCYLYFVSGLRPFLFYHNLH